MGSIRNSDDCALLEGTEWSSGNYCRCPFTVSVTVGVTPIVEEAIKPTVCSELYVEYCTTQEQCEQVSKYWYLNTCNSLPVTSITDASKCLQAGGDWYNNICYEEEVIV